MVKHLITYPGQTALGILFVLLYNKSNMADKDNNNKQAQPSDDQRTPDEKLKEKLGDIEIKKKEKLTEEKARELGMNYMNLVGFPISPDVLGLIDEETAKETKALTFFRDDKTIKYATVNPDNEEIQEIKKNIEKKHKQPVNLYLISEHSFERAMELYKSVVKVKKVTYGVTVTKEDLLRFQKEIASFDDLKKRLPDETNLTNFIVMVIASAKNA